MSNYTPTKLADALDMKAERARAAEKNAERTGEDRIAVAMAERARSYREAAE